jgi:hypothetical protein
MFAKTKIPKPKSRDTKMRFLMSVTSVLLVASVAIVLLTTSLGAGEKVGLESRNVSHAYESAGRSPAGAGRSLC